MSDTAVAGQMLGNFLRVFMLLFLLCVCSLHFVFLCGSNYMFCLIIRCPIRRLLDYLTQVQMRGHFLLVFMLLSFFCVWSLPLVFLCKSNYMFCFIAKNVWHIRIHIWQWVEMLSSCACFVCGICFNIRAFAYTSQHLLWCWYTFHILFKSVKNIHQAD